jgi:HIV Tat-specific factor 1
LIQNKKDRRKKAVKNTAVYVTGLPKDTTIEELESTFKKGGIIMIDAETSQPKIKLYYDQEGNFKGDALVIYYREESVDIACSLLDDTQFRYGSETNMKVEPAVFTPKEPKENDDLANQNSNGEVDKKKIQKAFQKLNKYCFCNVDSWNGMMKMLCN